MGENVSIFKPNNIIVPQNGTPNQTSLNQNKLNDDCGEEVSWAMQMKKDLEEQKKKDELDKKRKMEEDEINSKQNTTDTRPFKRKTQEEKLRELKAKMEEDEKRKSNPSQAEQMVNILEVMEKKRQRRMDRKNKLTEKERLEKEQASVKEAMYDEIIWALQLQKEIADEAGNQADV